MSKCVLVAAVDNIGVTIIQLQWRPLALGPQASGLGWAELGWGDEAVQSVAFLEQFTLLKMCQLILLLIFCCFVQ